MKIHFSFTGTFEVPDGSSLTSEASVVTINGWEVVLGLGASSGIMSAFDDTDLGEFGITNLSYDECEVSDKPIQTEVLEVQFYDSDSGWENFCTFSSDQEKEADRVLELVKQLSDREDYRIQRTQINTMLGAELKTEYRALVRHEKGNTTGLQLILIGYSTVTSVQAAITESRWDKELEGKSTHAPVGLVKGFNKDAVIAEARRIIPKKYTVTELKDLDFTSTPK